MNMGFAEGLLGLMVFILGSIVVAGVITLYLRFKHRKDKQVVSDGADSLRG